VLLKISDIRPGWEGKSGKERRSWLVAKRTVAGGENRMSFVFYNHNPRSKAEFNRTRGGGNDFEGKFL